MYVLARAGFDRQMRAGAAFQFEESLMSNPCAQIGRWYLRWDKGEIFQVTGHDTAARTIQIRTFDGDSEELGEDLWAGLPLGAADPPEDWAGPLETVDEIDMEFAQPPVDTSTASCPANAELDRRSDSQKR
jgi:Family of unknown function (DUF6763)